MNSVAHEMWRLASMPPAPMILGAMLLVFGWAVAFRKQDPDAWVMCATLLTVWFVELFFKAVLDAHAFRGFIAVTDMLCAMVAFKLGEKSNREWLILVYATLTWSIVLHILWLFGAFQVFLSKNDYLALLNILLATRLACIAFPGAAYVGKGVGDLLSSHSRRSAPSKARR